MLVARIVALVLLVACNNDPPAARDTKRTVAAPDPAALERDQQEYVEDIMAFTKTTREQVRKRMAEGTAPLAAEWTKWEQEGPMTEPRIKAFYKQTTNYIYELGEWHFFDPSKRESDLQLVADMKAKQPKNILDFGGGVGINALLLARTGFDVTLADLDGASLDFAKFRAERHGDKLKIWKSDVDAMPPDKKYDAILVLDVFEHLPKDELKKATDKLVKLKHAKTEVIFNSPFGRTAMHPMHIDLTPDTEQQIKRLKTEVPAE